MRIAKKFIIKGRVQGVGYRYFADKAANRIGVNGYVKNLYDGSVEVYAIGTIEQIKNLKEELLIGPSYSRVEKIIEEEVEIYNYNSFSVKF